MSSLNGVRVAERIDEEGVRWRPVPGFTRYEVSELGAVRNTVSDRTMAAFPQRGTGTMQVGLIKSVGSGQSIIPVAKVVCLAFYGVPEGYCEGKSLPKVVYLDNRKSNYKADNVRWAVKAVSDGVSPGVGALGTREPLRMGDMLDLVEKYTIKAVDVGAISKQTGMPIKNLIAYLRPWGYAMTGVGELMRIPEVEEVEGAGENLDQAGS